MSYMPIPLTGIETDTRRQAATDFTKALMQNFDQQVTTIIGAHIERFLSEYNANPTENWKAKDTAIYLLTSIAARGSTVQVSGLNDTVALSGLLICALVNPPLAARGHFHQCSSRCSSILLKQRIRRPSSGFGESSPYLTGRCYQVSIHFPESGTLEDVLSVFVAHVTEFTRFSPLQLTKDQLLSVLPLLVKHLEESNYVIYSYAAITIERILFIRHNGLMLLVYNVWLRSDFFDANGNITVSTGLARQTSGHLRRAF